MCIRENPSIHLIFFASYGEESTNNNAIQNTRTSAKIVLEKNVHGWLCYFCSGQTESDYAYLPAKIIPLKQLAYYCGKNLFILLIV